jgi:hypothetical protein
LGKSNKQSSLYQCILATGGGNLKYTFTFPIVLQNPIIFQEGNFGPYFQPNRKELDETVQNPPPKWIHLP